MRARLLAFAASVTLLAAHGARADEIVSVKSATVTGNAQACSPCGGDDAVTAAQSNVSPSQYGVDYNITSFTPSLEQTGVSTPGELTVSLGGATATESITTIDPSFTATVTGGGTSSGLYSTGEVVTGSSFDYYFEVIDPSDPGSTASTTVYVTTAGSVSISTSAVSGSSAGSNNGVALAELLISSGPGNTTLEELAEANYSYSTSGTSNLSTSNVTVALGTSSSASGGFTLSALPVTVDLDTQYEVELSVALNGAYVVDGTAYVDPIITASNGDEIFFSPGIAVPEPSTWAMMIVGFGWLGFLVLRRPRTGGDRRLS
jgi:hypothetical protein